MLLPGEVLSDQGLIRKEADCAADANISPKEHPSQTQVLYKYDLWLT